MIPRIKQKLLSLALKNEGVNGKFKLSAGLIYRKRLIATGVNSYRTHPIMLNGAYNEHQIHLHAEAACLVSAREIPSGSILYVVRVKRDANGVYTTGLAKPCRGCMSLIHHFGVETIEYTLDDQDTLDDESILVQRYT